ncbi:MAG: dihydrodipicolinate synthase family protein [Rhodospirillales bacterium]
MTDLHREIALWAPLLSHYAAGGGKLNLDRTAAHAAAVRGHVRGFLLAGSTGDGWDMDEDAFEDVLRLAERRDAFDSSCALLFGSLCADTASVIVRARRVESWAAEGRAAGTVIGHTVCPPVDKNADQAAILAHYESVLAETSLPIAVYQLPQITGCAVSAETLSRLTETGRVILFKDTSGEDAVVKSGFADARVHMLRGAEGLYAESLKPEGAYDGWLLSTANAFAPWLTEIEKGRGTPGGTPGGTPEVRALSARVAAAVESLFQAAAGLAFANPFSNANRAADHIMAWGAGWRAAPPPAALTGDALPAGLLETAEAALESLGPVPETGYLT